jgi:hypothetical protein
MVKISCLLLGLSGVAFGTVLGGAQGEAHDAAHHNANQAIWQVKHNQGQNLQVEHSNEWKGRVETPE